MAEGTRPSIGRRMLRSVTMISIVIVLAVSLPLARWMSASRAQESAVAIIKARQRGFVAYDYQFKDGAITQESSSWIPEIARDVFGDNLLHAVVYAHLPPGDEMTSILAQLHPLTGLRHLELVGVDEISGVDDATLAEIGTFRKLETLNIAYAPISNAGLAQLAPLVHLTKLDLTDARITNDGLRTIANFPELQVLNLDTTRIDDGGLVHLASLTKLESLNLDYTRVTTSGLAPLQNLKNLRRLSLNATFIDDAALERLVMFPNLEELSIADNPGLSERAIVGLGVLKQLRTLNVRGSRLSQSGAAELLQSLPRLQIKQD